MARSRKVQSGAAVQKSSISSSSGPLPATGAPAGENTGPAMARITRPAKARRNSSSQSGVRAGVASGFFWSRMSFSGGKAMRCGGGGVTRNNR
jgi:hypothetical protein